jgi:hypothetical protein
VSSLAINKNILKEERIMQDNNFYICDEDNVFAELDALYEDLQPSLYADAPGLNPDLEWAEESCYEDLPISNLDIDEAYGVDQVDFQRGDILIADVFQYGSNINLNHIRRPFVVIYANAYRAYGFQLTTGHPASLLNYIVEVPNHKDCGLKYPSSFNMSSVVSIELSRLVHRVGHITNEQRQVLIDKLNELKSNLSELDTYGWWTIEKIDQTILNLERISC